MSEQDDREPDEGVDSTPAEDGFPSEDVTPEDPDPELDVNDPFGVGDDREPLEDGTPDDAKDTTKDESEDDDLED